MQLIIAFALLGVLLMGGGFLLRPTPSARLRGDRGPAGVVLRPPRGRYAILAAMALGPTALVAIVAATAARKEGMSTAGVAVVALAIGAGLLVAGYFLLAERRTRVQVDDRGVQRIDPFRTQSIAWAQVEKLSYNGVSRWFYLAGPAGVRVWVPENLTGIGDFAAEALRHVPPAVVGADAATREALDQLVAEMREEDVRNGRAGA